MPARSGSRSARLQWVVVLVVGVLVATIVLGLKLIPRLNDGQKVLDSARPAFAADRVAADRAGINIISKNVDMANPIVTDQGGGAADVPTIVAYVAQANHISQAKALAVLQKNFPHTTALLQAIPLSSVTAELPGLLTFLEKTLKVTPAQLTAALKANFPHLYQSIANLPTVTNGWDSIPGTDGFTRFNGTPVSSVTQVRTYFGSDLIPVVEQQRENFASLDSRTSVNWVAPLLLIVAIIVILFAAGLLFRNRRRIAAGEVLASGVIVGVVGVVVVALVLVMSLIPRVSNGQKLLDGLKPAFAASRVHGDRLGINMVAAIVATEDPIMTAAGGGAAEVPKLIAFVSQKTGLSQAAVVAALAKNFPHTTALLEAIPISSVAAELPAVVKVLTPALGKIPALVPTVVNAPAVTAGWNNVPGAGGATNFHGGPLKTVPQIATYLSKDVVPVLETQRRHYENLTSISKIDFIGWLVLIVGIIVIIYGLLMVLLAWRWLPPRAAAARDPTPAPGGVSAPAA